MTLEEAEKRYPVGTKFYAAHLGNHPDNLCEVLIGDTFNIQGNYIHITRNDNITSCNEKGWWNCVYNDVKWADIYTLPELSEELQLKKELPARWCIEVTEDNFEMINNFKLFKKRESIIRNHDASFSYKYIDNEGYGYGYEYDCNKYHLTTDTEFLEYCKTNNIPLNHKEKVNEKLVILFDTEIDNNHDAVITIYTPEKQKTQEVQLFEVKKRRII